MNRTVVKEKFLHYLSDHPAAIKKLIDPSENTLADCVAQNYKCMEFIPKDKQTETVIKTYLEKNTYGHGSESYLAKNKEVAAKLSPETVEKFLKKNNRSNIIYFPQATKEMWIESAKEGYLQVDFKDIPEAVVCEELIGNLIENGYNYSSFIEQIPESLWTENLIKIALTKDGDYINYLPKSLVTKKWVKYAVKKESVRSLHIPAELWDKDLAEYVAAKTDLPYIPVALRSKEVCLKSIYDCMLSGNENIPEDLWKDKDIQIAYACKGTYHIEENVPAIKKLSFQTEALQVIISRIAADGEGKADVECLLDNMKPFIKDWIPILKLWPEAIKRIPKPDQTPEQIMTALQSRTVRDSMEVIATNLNLAKVTKEMAPLLLSVENSVVKDFVCRKFAPPKRADSATVSEVIVDITPEEFRNINR
jgi:hypothetical protein